MAAKTLKLNVMALALALWAIGSQDGNAHENEIEGVGLRLEAHWGGWSVDIIDGIVETGFNRRFGQPLMDFGPPLGQFGGTFTGEYNPYGPEPLPLTPNTTDDAILSTFIDRDFLQGVYGFPPDSLDLSGNNLPLRSALVQVGPSITNRASLPGIFDAPPYTAVMSEPNFAITWGDWKAASGTLIIACRSDESATLLAFFRNLIPNGVYSMWHFSAPLPGAPIPVNLQAAGGIPNVFTADERGRARWRREVNYCANTDNTTWSYAVAYHYDGSVYGNFPDAPLERLYDGVATGEVLAFPVGATVLE